MKELQINESNDISKEQFSKVVKQGLYDEINEDDSPTEKGK